MHQLLLLGKLARRHLGSEILRDSVPRSSVLASRCSLFESQTHLSPWSAERLFGSSGFQQFHGKDSVSSSPSPQFSTRAAAAAVDADDEEEQGKTVPKSTAAAMGQLGNGDEVASSGPRPYTDLPGPKGWPWFGQVFETAKHITDFTSLHRQWRDEFGPIVRYELMGRPEVMVFKPELIEEFYRTEVPSPIRPRLEFWATYREERGQALGVLLAENEEWKRSRVAMDKLIFTPKAAAKFQPIVLEVAKDLIPWVERNVGKGGVGPRTFANFQEAVPGYTLEAILAVLYHERFGCLSPNPPAEGAKFAKAIADFLKHSNNLLFNLPVYMLFKTPSFKKFEEGFTYMTEFATSKAKARVEMFLSGKAPDGDSMDLATMILSDKNLSMKEAISNMSDVTAGAVDTTAQLLSWHLNNLAQNPEAQERLHAEIVGVLGAEGEMSVEALDRMPLLSSSLKETMRLTPVVGSHARILQQDTVLWGYHFPKGMRISLDVRNLARDPEVFEAPDEYQVDRFVRGAAGGGRRLPFNPFAAIPFGHGPRKCIGHRIATLEVEMATAVLLHKYRLEYMNDEPVKATTRLILVPDRPINLAFHKR